MESKLTLDSLAGGSRCGCLLCLDSILELDCIRHGLELRRVVVLRPGMILIAGDGELSVMMEFSILSSS